MHEIEAALKALELLLRGAGCDARFLGEPVVDRLGELLDGVQLLLLGPGLSAERHENLLDGLKSEPAPAEIPVLELITGLQGTHNGNLMMWPCKTEELVRHLREVLLSAGHPREPHARIAKHQWGSKL